MGPTSNMAASPFDWRLSTDRDTTWPFPPSVCPARSPSQLAVGLFCLRLVQTSNNFKPDGRSFLPSGPRRLSGNDRRLFCLCLAPLRANLSHSLLQYLESGPRLLLARLPIIKVGSCEFIAARPKSTRLGRSVCVSIADGPRRLRNPRPPFVVAPPRTIVDGRWWRHHGVRCAS